MTSYTCEYCNVKCLPAGMDKHIKSKHDISDRDNSGYDEKTLTVKGKEFLVLFKEDSQLYRCTVCLVEGKRSIIESHLESKH